MLRLLSLPAAYTTFNGRRSAHRRHQPVVRAVQQAGAPVPAEPSVSSLSASLRSGRRRLPQNVDGEFFVDDACIDCDTCRWMAPLHEACWHPSVYTYQQTFTRVDHQSAVSRQPNSKEERIQALQALLSCPTSSIHTEKPPTDVVEVQDTFPLPIDDQKLPGVYHCGYHSEKSYGATSYLLIHPEGNVLIDSPRYFGKLAEKIEMLGGARYMFLTHKDDVADHVKWFKRLNCERILHSEDVEAHTADVEVKLTGSGPWSLGQGIQLIYTPGHSKGSVCLFYEPLKLIFTGDHLSLTENGLSLIEQYNHHSLSVQRQSIAKLIDLDFKWVLPGHGRRFEFKDLDEKRLALKALANE